MTNIKRAFGASAAITITLGGLTNGNSQESAAIDNSTDLFLDAVVKLAIKLQTGTPGSDLAILVYFAGSEDGASYTDNATGANAAITLRSPTNLRGPFIINTPTPGRLTY